jgi:hypothetical protein
MSDLKKELYNLCVSYARNRMDEAKMAVEVIEQSAKEETKSSAGDKYETSREMMQQETDRNMAQLNEAKKLMVALSQISHNNISTSAEAGSVVFTTNGNFYIAISAGTMSVNGDTFFAVSPASPIGLKLRGLKPGDEFTLNYKHYQVKEIY